MSMRDPAASPAFDADSGLSQRHLRRRRLQLALALLSLLLLAAAWKWTPLQQLLDLAQLRASLRALGEAAGPIGIVAAFAVASVLAVPLTFLTVLTLLVSGAWGIAYTVLGASGGALASFVIGRRLGHDMVERIAGRRVSDLSRRLARRGVLTVVALRMVPVAPFAVVNMVAGISHLRLRDFMVGNMLGIAPGATLMFFFMDRLEELARRLG